MSISCIALESERHAACQLLFTGVPDPYRSQQVATLEQYFASGELDPSGLLVLRDGTTLTGVILLTRGVGNAATVGLPRTLHNSPASQLELVRLACDVLRAWNVDYAQVVLAPADYAFQELYRQAGFRYLTQLEFYRLELKHAPEPTLPKGIRLEAVQPHQYEDFTRMIFETYIESLDSAELNGIRKEADIFAEYESSSYTPPRWWLVYLENQPIGVLILSPGSGGSCELSYLGLVPGIRGKRLSTPLLKFALYQAQQLADVVRLSVDERNFPARQLYLRAGFTLYQLRRILWWHPASGTR